MLRPEPALLEVEDGMFLLAAPVIMMTPRIRGRCGRCSMTFGSRRTLLISTKSFLENKLPKLMAAFPASYGVRQGNREKSAADNQNYMPAAPIQMDMRHMPVM